jgi:hypothetical protein
MTGVGPTSQPPAGAPPTPSPAVQRANRMSAANMIRSLAPLVVICLVLVGWATFRQGEVDPVREVDPAGTLQLAVARAGYPVVAPAGLPDGYRVTSARTDAGGADPGDPVTVEVGYLTPSGEFAGFVVSDDARADALTDVLDDAETEGTVELGGQDWTRSTTGRGETALWREDAGVTVLVTGSADDDELAAVATAVRPHTG